MYPVSNAARALFEAGNAQVLRITGTDRNGRSITITEADAMGSSFCIDRYSCNGEKLEIGTAIAAQMTLRLNNESGKFDSAVFEGTELSVEVGVADWTQESPTVYWVPCGLFTPDRQPRRMTTISLTALDRMTRFDAVLVASTPWTDEHGNVFVDASGNVICFESALNFPTTIAGLVAQVCELCYVPCTQDLSTLPNAGYTLSEMPDMQQGYTLRNLIQWCAGIMGTNAWIRWDGELVFSWYGEATGFTCEGANRYSSDLHEEDITITGVTYTNTQGITIVAGTSAYALDMTGNTLAATGIAEILPNVEAAISGFKYRPFEARIRSAPYFWPMDGLTFTDKDGQSHATILTNVNFGLNGLMTMAGRGETAQTNSMASPGGMTPQQAFILSQAMEATAKQAEEGAEESVDEMLTQQEIFDRLTGGGSSQGLYLYNGKVYLDATYIGAGFLSANRIDAHTIGVDKLTSSISGGINNSWVLDFTTGTLTIGKISADDIQSGTLTLGGANNANGLLTVKDAQGNVIGTWDNTGISMSKGTIAGPTITLGGANNQNGTLTVLDAQGNTIGTWGKDGIVMDAGSISANLINGGTLTLGGLNNVDGQLVVKDSSDSPIGYWDAGGIRILQGEISGASISLGGTANADGTLEIKNAGGAVKGTWDNTGLTISDTQANVKYESIINNLGGIQNNRYLNNALVYGLEISGASITFTDSNGMLSYIGGATGDNFYVKLSASDEAISCTYDNGVPKITLSDNVFIWEDLTVNGALDVLGAKDRLVQTEDYGQRRLAAYETPTPMFGDVGEGVIGADGLCYVSIDPVFAQTVNTAQYQVFLQKYGEGDIWVKDRRGGWFIVKGTPGMAFGWEIKARQRGYEQRRMDKKGDGYRTPKASYGEDAARYINALTKGRISA